MSGPLSTHRTGNRPLIVDGEPVVKLDNYGRPVKVHTLKPGMENRNGRPTGYQVFETFAHAHVLDYTPELYRPSKHAAGRIRPRTPREQRRAQALQARFTRLGKRVTVLRKQGVAFDELAGVAA